MQGITEPNPSVESTVPSKISYNDAIEFLGNSVPLMELVAKANGIRESYFGKKVRIHILDNIKNGHCPEDCGYCAQRKNASSGISQYPTKSEDEIFEDAKKAKDAGAYRFCMVTAGTGPNQKSITSLSRTIRRISEELNLKVCLSAGLLDENGARELKDSGLDRYNHNLNTSESHYGEICSSHTFQDRINTLKHLSGAGVGLCSGIIVGMGESHRDLVEVAFKLKELKVISIPINFFIPISGHAIKNPNHLNPEFCIRILSVFRLVNPDSEIRVGAGREGHLRGLQSLSLYVANSLFASGYLNVKGSEINETIQMINDSGFEPEFEGYQFTQPPAPNPYSEDKIKSLYKFPK